MTIRWATGCLMGLAGAGQRTGAGAGSRLPISTRASSFASSSPHRRAAASISTAASSRAISARHIPGNPTVIVQNMPGAGGLAAANHLYTRAEKDGLTIGIIQGPLTYAQVGKSSNVQFDMTKFGWLGSANVTSDVCVFSKRVVHRQAGRPSDQTDHHRRLRRLDRIQPEPAQRAGRNEIQAGEGLRARPTACCRRSSAAKSRACAAGAGTARGWSGATISRAASSRSGLEVGRRAQSRTGEAWRALRDGSDDQRGEQEASHVPDGLSRLYPSVHGAARHPGRSTQGAAGRIRRNAEGSRSAGGSRADRAWKCTMPRPRGCTRCCRRFSTRPEAIKTRALDELRKAGWEGLSQSTAPPDGAQRIRDSRAAATVPDFASLHPGYLLSALESSLFILALSFVVHDPKQT